MFSYSELLQFSRLVCVSHHFFSCKRACFVRGHSLSKHVKFSEKLTFLTPWFAYKRVKYQELRNVSFLENIAHELNEWSLAKKWQLSWYLMDNVIFRCASICFFGNLSLILFFCAVLFYYWILVKPVDMFWIHIFRVASLSLHS